MRRSALLATFGLIMLALIVWAPWMTGARAEARAAQAFDTAWRDVSDGCGFNCTGCAARQVRRLPAGYSVELEYACGLLPQDAPEFHQTDTVFVSCLGTVHGLARP
jgi:hypothetical protein